jgi:hypothetical protein
MRQCRVRADIGLNTLNYSKVSTQITLGWVAVRFVAVRRIRQFVALYQPHPSLNIGPSNPYRSPLGRHSGGDGRGSSGKRDQVLLQSLLTGARVIRRLVALYQPSPTLPTAWRHMSRKFVERVQSGVVKYLRATGICIFYIAKLVCQASTPTRSHPLSRSHPTYR